MDPSLQEAQGLRIAVEGCGHGTLDAIYASVKKACEVRDWDGVDLLIIGGDFQAVRNASDLTVMSCPVKYRAIGDFHSYYSGITTAPYLTIFVGGNHEASSHLWELYYGGWVAPNIYYMGAASVVRLGGVRIAGMSGIWKGYNFRKSHHERLPYNQDDIKSIYHIRELDVRKLLQLRTQVDIGISHDWPKAIERNGNERALFRIKPDFEQESRDGTLGSDAAKYVMDRLRPPYWFAAHMHCKFSATKTYEDQRDQVSAPQPMNGSTADPGPPIIPHNDDEIDLDMDEDDAPPQLPIPNNELHSAGSKDDEKSDEPSASNADSSRMSVPLDIRAQLPAAFSKLPDRRNQAGQPTPPGVTNKTVRFLALDKCLPGRKFLQLVEVQPNTASAVKNGISSTALPVTRPTLKLEYDPEWLAITRVFAGDLVLGDKSAKPAEDLGEDGYRSLIQKEEEWVDEHIVKKGKLSVPENFTITAPPFFVGMPEIIEEAPKEWNNPQTQEFCDLVGIENKFFATDEEREERNRQGPAPVDDRQSSRGRGRDWGHGGGSRGRGQGHGRGRGRGGQRGRGRGWGKGW